MNRVPYIIIGNSVAGVAGVSGIRNTDANRPITLISDEPHHTYSRPLISYLLAGKVDEDAMHYRAPDFYERSNVRPLLGTRVRRVNTRQRTVTLGEGDELGFEKLLIATGGAPIVPRDVEGVDADGVFTFTTWDHARKVGDYIEARGITDAVVVGGGLIGLKSMEALVERSIRTTVVELADQVLGATFDRTASRLARGLLEEAGVSVRCGTTVARIITADDRTVGVELRDGTEVSCGLVMFAIGVSPNTGIVADTAVRTDRGILVGDTMMTSVEGIYAAGDVAQARELLSGESRCIPILPDAYRQGFIAGCNMAGGRHVYSGGLAMNAVEVLGVPTVSVGQTAPDGDGYEVLSQLDEEQPLYRKIVLRDNRVVGAVFFGDIDRAGIITGLIREGLDVSQFKDLLLTDEFGLISLPRQYRKHVVSGQGILV